MSPAIQIVDLKKKKKKLSITDRCEGDAEDITEILKAVVPKLQTLEWFVGPSWRTCLQLRLSFLSNCDTGSDKYLNIPLNLMLNLCSLCFFASSHDSNIYKGMARLTEAIRNIPPGSMAEELSVTLYITRVFNYKRLIYDAESSFWPEFDSALAFAPVQLRRVNIYFNVSFPNLAQKKIKMAINEAYWRLFKKMPLPRKAQVLQVQAGINLMKIGYGDGRVQWVIVNCSIVSLGEEYHALYICRYIIQQYILIILNYDQIKTPTPSPSRPAIATLHVKQVPPLRLTTACFPLSAHQALATVSPPSHCALITNTFRPPLSSNDFKSLTETTLSL
jgi:hypothetical protein